MSQKLNKKLYFLSLQGKNKQTLYIYHSKNYDTLLLKAMGALKEKPECKFWTILDSSGKYIDGNFPNYDE